MEENNKQLLIKDICARLPYGVYVKFKQYNEPLYLSVKDTLAIYNGGELINDLQYLYLRPMSSMTEEEMKTYNYLLNQISITQDMLKVPRRAYHLFHWLLSLGFDYYGLIEKGLALKAPEGMYNIKTTCNNCEDKSYCSQSEYVKNNCYKLK